VAQDPQEALTRTRRALVLDANILLRAVLGPRVRNLILRYAEEVALLTPSIAVDDTREYLPALCAKRRWHLAPALEVLEQLLALLQVVEIEFLEHLESQARARISVRDAKDWPVLALALAVDAPVWTEDQDFFGSGVATWTTATVELYLARRDS
jgi:predicted nucleic acid-binding protein